MIWLLAAGAIIVGPSPVVNGVAYPDIMPASQIRSGMRGYGLTVFRGTKIERFDVTVVAVVRNGSLIAPGHDMILIRMSGGPMTQRGANLIRGMSGSPIYIHGKCIGAFSQGEPTTKEPLGGVTPIMDMLEAWDPKLPAKFEARVPAARAPRTVELGSPIRHGDRLIRRIAFDAPPGMPRRKETLQLRPCTGMVTLTGGSRRSLSRLKELLEPYGVEVMQAPAGKSGAPIVGASLNPGAALSILLLKGDVETGATGTVTYRRGNRLLAFGHPFLGIGPIGAPICPATVHDVYPLNAGSYKISTPGPTLGVTQQDRLFGVSAVVGQKAPMIPIAVDVDDRTTGRARLYRMEAVSHPNLTAGLISLGVGSAIADIHGTPGPVMARIQTVVEAEELGRIERRNYVHDARAIDLAATTDLDAILGVVTANPFQPLAVRSVSVKCVIEPGRKTAVIEKVSVKSARYEPGDTVEVEVTLKPYRGEAITKTASVVIPETVSGGQLTLSVRGGGAASPVSLGGIVFRPSSAPTPDQSPPTSVRQMLARLLEREAGDEVAVRLALPTSAVTVDGRTLSGLPPTLDAALRSPRTAGVRLDGDQVRSVLQTDWVVTGQQTLTIQVQREPQAAAPPRPGDSSSSGAGGSGSSAGGPRVITEFEFGMEQGAAQSRRTNNSTDPQTARRQPSPQAQVNQSPQTPAAPTATEAAADKPVARVARIWRHTARTDWKRVTKRRVGITSDGEAVPIAYAAKACTLPASVVWCMVGDGAEGVYAGVGPEAAVCHVTASGEVTTVTRLPEVSVHALLRMTDGTLYAGTAPNGRTYRIAPGRAPEVAHDAEESYVLSLAGGSDGSVYVGAGGPSGAVYRVRPTGEIEIVARPLDRHVQALAVDGEGNVWAGTSGRGLVVQIRPDGRTETRFDVPGQSITAILPVRDRGLLVSSGPRAGLFSIDGAGNPKELTLDGASAVMALLQAGEGEFIAAGGATAWRLHGDRLTPLEMPPGVEILSMALAGPGKVWLGTANAGDVLRADLKVNARSGELVSGVLDAGVESRWGGLRWTGTSANGGSIVIHTRSGDSAEPDGTWSAWAPLRPTAEGGDITSPMARYLQYRATLAVPDNGATAALRDVTISYLPRNRPPTVAFQSPSGGERWSGSQTLRWQASDPDGDTLAYELDHSDDGGTTWTRLPAAEASEKPREAAARSAQPATTPSQSGSAGRRPLTVEQVTAELDKHPGVPAAMREAILERTRNLNAEYAQGRSQQASPAASVPAPTRETSRTVDTSKLKDGIYRFRVIASDRPSNWDTPGTATAVSEPIIICNAAPVVHVLRSQPMVTEQGAVRVEAVVAQALVPITAAQWRVDGGEWSAARPADGLADSGLELFVVETGVLQSGKRTVELKVFNAAGVTATEKVEVEVPAAKR